MSVFSLFLFYLRRETLDRELRSLAAFSPLFIVERAAKYITLQYRPEGSSIDYEISIEGLDLSFAQGGSRLSRCFSVHVQPPNDRVRRLLESGIGDLLQQLSTKQASVHHVREHAGVRQTDTEFIIYIAQYYAMLLTADPCLPLNGSSSNHLTNAFAVITTQRLQGSSVGAAGDSCARQR
ncbi:non-muscle myosin heavy chain, putative [Eimeria mitis]|uniref:Non-muscle myosin heavy chain, putative n=1 Tax=Eimeria mitis TaxID=44415 RepID=U6KC05_9EIME|nr:non-muscle myosin heavy chain, putative [Eimeria mitis]CDJ35550.1 non-muscle myosin heavy chain, putative [Eimeria mitis]